MFTIVGHLSFVGVCETSTETSHLAQEISELEDWALTYKPNLFGREPRIKDFKSNALAFLFLSAIKEQYEVLPFEIEGTTQTQTELMKFHRAYHLFENDISEVFSIKAWVRLYYSLFPALDDVIPIEEIGTYRNLQELRYSLFREMSQTFSADDHSRKGELVRKIQDELLRLNLPSVQQDARWQYLHALFIDEKNEGDPELNDLQFQLYQKVLEKIDFKPCPYPDAIRFFKQLRSYFETDLNSNYFFWTKYLPSPEGGTLRFYLTPKELFHQEVFEIMLPRYIAYAWQGIKNSSSHPKSDTAFALKSICHFYSRHVGALSERAYRRIFRAFKLIHQDALDRHLTTTDWNIWTETQDEIQTGIAFSPENIITGKVEIELENGLVITNENLFAAHGLSNADVGIVSLLYKGHGVKVSVENDVEARSLSSFETGDDFLSSIAPFLTWYSHSQYHYGVLSDIVGLKTDEYQPFGWRLKDGSGAFYIREFDKTVTISALSIGH